MLVLAPPGTMLKCVPTFIYITYLLFLYSAILCLPCIVRLSDKGQSLSMLVSRIRKFSTEKNHRVSNEQFIAIKVILTNQLDIV